MSSKYNPRRLKRGPADPGAIGQWWTLALNRRTSHGSWTAVTEQRSHRFGYRRLASVAGQSGDCAPLRRRTPSRWGAPADSWPPGAIGQWWTLAPNCRTSHGSWTAVTEQRSHRFGIVGVLDHRGLEDELGEGLVVEERETALARLLPEVRAKADVVVLLAFTDEPTLAALAQQFYEVDVILGGKVRQPAQSLAKGNRSLVFFTTNESRALNVLRLRISGKSLIEPLKSDIRLLHDAIAEDPSIQALAAAYRAEVREKKVAVDTPEHLATDLVPGVRAAASYVGSARCLDCHGTAAQVWQRAGHARAFATLVRKQADADSKCLGCHTIGFGTLSGYQRAFEGAQLGNAGCESCHGPGSLHTRQQEDDATVSFRFRPLGAGDCTKCHYGEFSRPFDWDTFWPPVAHGLGAVEGEVSRAPGPVGEAEAVGQRR